LRSALALAAVGLLAACSSSKAPPAEPLTSVDLSGAVGLFAVTTTGPKVTWYRLLADGSFRSTATQGTVVPTLTFGPDGPATRNITTPDPIQMTRLSPNLVLVRFASAPTTDAGQAYLQQGQVLDLRTGRIDEGWPNAGRMSCGGAPDCTWPAWTSQPMGDGALAVLSSSYPNFLPVAPGAVYSTALVGSTWTERWPLTPQLRTTDLFAVDAAGNLAIRGLVSGGPPTFIPATGPMVESPLDGTFGDFWTGPDGAIRSTRLVGDVAGTVELIRFDLSTTGQVTATATASWTGTGLLTGWPITMGQTTVFMIGTQPLVFDTPDATPVLHPALGIIWTRLQATAHALWFTAGTSGAGYLVRWTRAGTDELHPTAPWSYYDLFPIADDDVLIGAWDTVGGKGAVLRSNGTSAPTPVDLGDSPALRGHIRW
jgi:hypothetical protein